jgi:Delta6-protoilludene synthase
MESATPSSQKHFVEAFSDYLDSVVEQAEDRDKDIYRDIDNYFPTRRQNIGSRPSFVPAELGLDLPDDAFYHPVVLELSEYITDLIILDNVSFRQVFIVISEPH